MKSSIVFFQFLGLIFVSVSGVLLHFAFDWSDGSFFIAPFSAVNESIWEHMKLLFYPMLGFAVLEHRLLKDPGPSFWYVKMKGILLGFVLIPVIYYTYTGALGVMADWFNIAIFFIVSAILLLLAALFRPLYPTPIL